MDILKDRISFNSIGTIENSNGFTEDTEVEIYPCRANAKHLSGKAYFSNSAYVEEIVISFRVRNCALINGLVTRDSSEYHIKYKGQKYSIIFVNPFDSYHTDFKCKLVR